MVPSASTNMMLVPPAPRSPQDFSSIAARSGTKLVSHMWLPGRTVMRSPSPEKYSFLPVRSANSNGWSRTRSARCGRCSSPAAGRWWRRFSARSRPQPLKCRCLALSGIANRLRGPHSKLFCCRRQIRSGSSRCPPARRPRPRRGGAAGRWSRPAEYRTRTYWQNRRGPSDARRRPCTPARGHSAVSTDNRSTPISSVTWSPSAATQSR